jgi:hypothetical protein
MFDFRAEDNGFNGWIDRWRAWRGIDRWPIVSAEIVKKEWVDSGEGGGYYKLTLKYRVPSKSEESRVLTIVTMSVNPGSPGSELDTGEHIQLHAHPEKINKVVFADSTESSRTLQIVIIFLGVFLIIGGMKGCDYISSDPPSATHQH